MLAVPETFTWPARRRAVAYVQVGDFVEMLFHGKSSAFSACEFCQTVNHSAAGRCRTCGGALPARAEDEQPVRAETEPGDDPGFSDARSLRNALLLVLLPPLLLFAVFVAWYQLRAHPVVPPAPLAAAHAAAAENAKGAKDAKQPARVRLPSLETQRLAEEELDAAQLQLQPAPVVPESRPAPRPARAVQPAVVRRSEDPVAGCSGGNFFSRAICVNSRCADPKAARLGACREAVRQRRIDEARRNPTLVG